MSYLLELDRVSINFGGLQAVDEVSMRIEEGKIRALIGPNGAGKSTVFNLVTGIYKPTAGRILYQGQSIVGLGPHAITALGIARTFQNIRLFGRLTVLDNVKIGCHCRSRGGMWGAILRWPGVKREEAEITARALEALEIMELVDKRDEYARSLSYGEQRRLEIARALATRPRLLLLDEPAAGMNPQEKQVLMQMIRRIQDMGITIFLVEHDMKFVMSLSDRITVLDYGRRIAAGTPEEIQSDPAVIAAYLGQEVSYG
ncbi:MAG: ABC transporter ATP-binding protein [Desulfurispora sp.]|uniref:ABC transporter ATP-binding protein n=1 Tax=Desulfurispora sp. TaxID=3014275 RepID=UPI00404B30ED